MSIEILRQLRKKAELILSPGDLGEIPIIQKSLAQIEKETKAVNERIKSTQELHAKAHYFLASNGIDTNYVANPINTSRTFQITQLENHTDIKSFLEEEHEKILIENIEEQRRNNNNFEIFFKSKIESFIKESDSDRMEEDENAIDLQEFEKYNNSTAVTRIADYAVVVDTLNSNRLIDTDYDLIANLSNIRNLSDLQKSQDGAYESWDIIRHLVNKSGVDGRPEGRFLKDYTIQPNYSATATNTRRLLSNASKSWLQQQYFQLINDKLNKNAKVLHVGGNPSVSHRLRAYINYAYETGTEWTDPRLEIVEGLPIWTFIYLLLRIGHLDIATKFVDTHSEMFTSEKKFVSYFEEYATSKNHCVSEFTQKAILADYHRFNYGETTVDPYKVFLYKIIGRCELHQKIFPDIITTTEDYIWLQLMLVREVKDTEKYSFERYRLADLQKVISSLGSKYFDPDETNPWVYFKLLLLTNQFEEAIDHLYKQKRLRLETVHFAVALVYHGILKIPRPEKERTIASTIVFIGENNFATLNFPRLIYQYVQAYASDKPKDALQYLCLLSLYSRKQGYPNDEMVNLAKSYICDFTMTSKDFKALIGSHQGNQRIPGLIDGVKKLLNIVTESDYAQQIIHPIAEMCVQTGRCMDAAYAYSLSGDHNKMADVLSKELSDALQQPQSFRVTNPTLSELPNEEIIGSAVNTMEYYENNQYISSRIDDIRKYTVRILIQLLQFRVAYEKNEFEKALRIIGHANVIPLEANMSLINFLVAQFETFAESIKKNIPEILLNVMDILYKVWLEYMSTSVSVPTSELESLEQKARTLLTFTGFLQFSIPADIIVRLNKVDMLMSARRS